MRFEKEVETIVGTVRTIARSCVEDDTATIRDLEAAQQLLNALEYVVQMDQPHEDVPDPDNPPFEHGTFVSLAGFPKGFMLFRRKNGQYYVTSEDNPNEQLNNVPLKGPQDAAAFINQFLDNSTYGSPEDTRAAQGS